ncbi:hypothetical protein ACLOJK_034430 [Asimina triloba]
MIFGAPPEHPYGAPSPSTRPAAMAAGGELATAASTIPILCLLPFDGEQHAHPSDQRLRFKSGQSTIIFIHPSRATGDSVHAPSRQPPNSNGQVPSSSTPLPPEPVGHGPAANTQIVVFLPFSPSDAVQHQWPTDPAESQPSDPPAPSADEHPDLDGDTSPWPTIPSASVLHSIFSTVGNIVPASVHHHHGRSPIRPLCLARSRLQQPSIFFSDVPPRSSRLPRQPADDLLPEPTAPPDLHRQPHPTAMSRLQRPLTPARSSRPIEIKPISSTNSTRPAIAHHDPAELASRWTTPPPFAINEHQTPKIQQPMCNNQNN